MHPKKINLNAAQIFVIAELFKQYAETPIELDADHLEASETFLGNHLHVEFVPTNKGSGENAVEVHAYGVTNNSWVEFTFYGGVMYKDYRDMWQWDDEHMPALEFRDASYDDVLFPHEEEPWIL